MIGRIWQKLTRDQRGVTLTELTVTVTIIGILGAVVATGVGGSVTQGNESARSQLFAAVQGAVDAFGQNNLPADGNLTKAQFPFNRGFGVNQGNSNSVTFSTGDKPASTAGANEQVSRDWYRSDGKFLHPQPGMSTATTATALAKDTFIYVDLYSGGTDCLAATGSDKDSYSTTGVSFLKTDLRCLGAVKAPAGKTFGTPGTPGNVIRCIFASNEDTVLIRDSKTHNLVVTFGTDTSAGADPTTEGTVTQLNGQTSAQIQVVGRAAIGHNKGALLACRDADPSGST